MSCFSSETLEGIQCLFFFFKYLSNLSKQGLQTGTLHTHRLEAPQGAHSDGPVQPEAVYTAVKKV